MRYAPILARSVLGAPCLRHCGCRQHPHAACGWALDAFIAPVRHRTRRQGERCGKRPSAARVACEGQDLADPGRVMKADGQLRREVNWETPEFIAAVRKRFDLGQREAARLFGGGVNAFSRYETRLTKPPLALVRLFQVLDKHPKLLVEIASRADGC